MTKSQLLDALKNVWNNSVFGMVSTRLRPEFSHLLKLPANERAELAMALWESLSDAERDAEFGLSAEQQAELDRRWVEHLADPTSAIPWDELRRKLLARA